MLYKFKSKVSGDLLMLGSDVQRILSIIGKDAGPVGIILPAQMGAAVGALEKAIEEEMVPGPPAQARASDDADAREAEVVTLRQRAVPFIEMLQRCEREHAEIVWESAA